MEIEMSSYLRRGLIKNRDTLARSRLHLDVLEILEVGLAAADPRSAVRRFVSLRGNLLCLQEVCSKLSGEVHVVGFGKAGAGMALGCEDSLGDIIAGGVVIVPTLDVPERPKKIELVEGDHPIPGEKTLKASQALVSYVRENVKEGDVVIVLISGGGSALFEIPYPPLTLDDVAVTTRNLMKAGADIIELNTVRKHISLVKGGRFLRFLDKANAVFSLIVSDVVGDPPEFIASGPTEADTTTFKDAYEVLQRRKIWDQIPDRVRNVILMGVSGEVPETLKPGDRLLTRVRNFIVASNSISLERMKAKAIELGYKAMILTSMMVGEAREIGKFLGSVARYFAKYKDPEEKIIILLGGETTVTVQGSGIGGRNQELCVGFSLSTRGMSNVVLASIGTDGIDGNSPAAGGICDGHLVNEAVELGMDPHRYLLNNDTYTLLSSLGRAVVTGPTGTNVNDLVVIAVG
jgi:glycerate 2-kinase